VKARNSLRDAQLTMLKRAYMNLVTTECAGMPPLYPEDKACVVHVLQYNTKALVFYLTKSQNSCTWLIRCDEKHDFPSATHDSKIYAKLGEGRGELALPTYVSLVVCTQLRKQLSHPEIGEQKALDCLKSMWFPDRPICSCLWEETWGLKGQFWSYECCTSLLSEFYESPIALASDLTAIVS